MFRGRFDHSLDDKGRLAIPSRYRELLVDANDVATIVVTNFDRCLCAYSLKEWEKLEKKVAELPQFDPKVLAFQRYFISGAVELTVDKAGRVLIPANLREFCGISRDCVIVGQLTKFEIWPSDKWQEVFNGLSDFGTMSNIMAELNIRL